ncbi:MAG: hypothetical protein Q8932_13735, partial [Bacteroidota bacterium]|nr:hypothetical protein [Bacteroidota bacterium]
MTKLTFNNKANAFYTSVKAAVDQYFISSKQKKTGNWKLYLKSGTLIPGALFMYMGLLPDLAMARDHTLGWRHRLYRA